MSVPWLSCRDAVTGLVSLLCPALPASAGIASIIVIVRRCVQALALAHAIGTFLNALQSLSPLLCFLLFMCVWQSALACCLVALFSMCLWFVRVTIIQRRRQLMMEMQWLASRPSVMTEDEIAALPAEKYQVSRPIRNAPLGSLYSYVGT